MKQLRGLRGGVSGSEGELVSHYLGVLGPSFPMLCSAQADT